MNQVRHERTRDWRAAFTRLRADERAAVERLAEDQGRSLSGQIRVMLRQQLADENRERLMRTQAQTRGDRPARNAAVGDGQKGSDGGGR